MFNSTTIKETKQNFGDWCKALRKRENLSQQRLAEELGVSRLTIAKLENGENVTLDTLLKVLQFFDEMKSINDFIHDQRPTNSSQSMY